MVEKSRMRIRDAMKGSREGHAFITMGGGSKAQPPEPPQEEEEMALLTFKGSVAAGAGAYLHCCGNYPANRIMPPPDVAKS